MTKMMGHVRARKALFCVAALACALAIGLLAGCSPDGEDDYHVYQVDSASGNYTEYDIVYYDYRSSYDGDALTGFIDETHYSSSAYTRDDIVSITNDLYPGIDDISCVSASITDEGDYYCCIVRFDDLDELDNLQDIYDHDLLFANSEEKADALVGTTMFETSITIQGGKLIEEEDVPSLGLHFNAEE